MPVQPDPDQGDLPFSQVEISDPRSVPTSTTNETQISLRLLMDRHKLSYRAMNDLISLMRLTPDMKKIKSVQDIIRRSSELKVEMEKICAHCYGGIVDDNCIDESW